MKNIYTEIFTEKTRDELIGVAEGGCECEYFNDAGDWLEMPEEYERCAPCLANAAVVAVDRVEKMEWDLARSKERVAKLEYLLEVSQSRLRHVNLEFSTHLFERTQSLEFNAYQTAAATTADYARMGKNPNYPALGLAGEAGEVCEHIKKVERDDDGRITPERRKALKKEIGDVLWYVATICTELDLRLADVAQGNLDKLADRKARGVIHGSGDER